jgi:hypothetical protein
MLTGDRSRVREYSLAAYGRVLSSHVGGFESLAGARDPPARREAFF